MSSISTTFVRHAFFVYSKSIIAKGTTYFGLASEGAFYSHNDRIRGSASTQYQRTRVDVLYYLELSQKE